MGEAANYTQSIVFTHNLKPQSRDISLYELLVIALLLSSESSDNGHRIHFNSSRNHKCLVWPLIYNPILIYFILWQKFLFQIDTLDQILS